MNHELLCDLADRHGVDHPAGYSVQTLEAGGYGLVAYARTATGALWAVGVARLTEMEATLAVDGFSLWTRLDRVQPERWRWIDDDEADEILGTHARADETVVLADCRRCGRGTRTVAVHTNYGRQEAAHCRSCDLVDVDREALR